MKQIAFLFKIALCLLYSTTQAQVQILFSENFDKLAVGEVSTDPTGATPGKGGWYVTKLTTPYTFPVEIIPEAGRGNVVAIGSHTNNINGNGNGATLTQKNIQTLWNKRTVGNNILKLEYDIYLIGSNQHRIASNVNLVNNSNNRATLNVSMNNYNGNGTPSIIQSFLRALYYDTASTPNLKHIYLGANNTPEYNNFLYNTWLSVELFIDYKYEAGTVAGGAIYVYIPALNIFKTANFTHNEDIDLLSIRGGAVSGNLSVVVKYDNIKLSALQTLPSYILSVSEQFAAKFNLYPNPATNVVTITNVENMQVQQVAVYDVAGKLITTQNFNEQAEIQLNVENLASGTYILNLQTNEGTAVKKLLKK